MCSVLSPFSSARLSATLWTAAARLLCPWDSPGKHTGLSFHGLLQGIFLTQGSNLCLLCLMHCRQMSYSWATSGAHILIALPFGLAFSFRSPQCSRVPCAIPWFIFVIYSINKINSEYVSILTSHSSSLPLWYSYICSLRLYLYFFFANKIIYTIFLDSTCMR